jgi:hypothetical protein
MPRLSMINSTTRYLLFLSLCLFSFPLIPINVNAQEATESTPSTAAESIFSIEGGKKLMTEADQAIDNQQYDVAVQKLQSARQVYNQLSNFYLQLFNSFTGIDNAAAESHRKKALETSMERDNATYQLALVHRAQEKSELSIPLLVQIVTSQSPGSGLGKKAYEQLLEIGFVDVPFTPPGKGNNPSVQPSAPAEQPPADVAPQIPSSVPPSTPNPLPGDPQ